MSSSPRSRYVKDELPSDLRKNAKVIEKSRNDWKEKHRERMLEIKALKTRVEEARASRDYYKEEKTKIIEELKNTYRENDLLKKEVIRLTFEKEELLKKEDLKKTKQPPS